MKKRSRIGLSILVLAAVILCTMRECYLSDLRPATVSSGGAHYTIDPDTILDALDHARDDIFILREPFVWGIEMPDLAVDGEPVEWKQEDYYRVARALFAHSWGDDSIKTWKLGGMIFDVDCEDLEHGLQDADFSYYKYVTEDHEEYRIDRHLYIEPKSKYARTSFEKSFPALKNSKPIDLAKTKVSADRALQIAEQNGGFETRFAVGNMCDIFLILKLGTMYSGWLVEYEQLSDNNFERLFRIHIDPGNAEFEVVYP